MIDLGHGDWRLVVDPELGGCIRTLRVGGRDVLRPAPDKARDMLATACFPLAPYANRIADGRFAFDGREATLPVLEPFAPHALHGDAWQGPWTTLERTGDAARMRFEGGGDGWPWPYRVEQTLRLGDGGLRIDLVLTNRGDGVMPASLGLHPYFAIEPETRLRLSADGVWLTDAREIPERLAPPDAVIDWSDGASVAEAPFVDHCYSGWSGEARLEHGDFAVVVRASDNARWAQVYAPGGEPFVCVEPVTHRPDAVHAPDGEDSGLVRLAPGATLSMWMEIDVVDRG